MSIPLPEELVSYEDAMKELEMPVPLFTAFLHSGMFGYTKEGKVTRTGLEQFRKYGTQWRSDLPPRHFPFDLVPRSVKRAEGDLSIGSTMWIRIAPGDVLDVADKDKGWIVQFYLIANHFYFPNPYEMSLIGPIQLKIEGPLKVEGFDYKTTVYPSPDGAIAMIMVASKFGDLAFDKPDAADAAYRRAYSVVAPLLDELSAISDHPLPVAQTLVIGVPSGTIMIRFARPPKTGTFKPSEFTSAICPFPELSDAMALYREAISSNNPLHQFLTLWKVMENVVRVRSDWRREKKKDMKRIDEVIPNLPEFGEVVGLPFEQAKEKLNRPYRVALAHGNVVGGEPITHANIDQVLDVGYHIPVIRYMARVVLMNMRNSLSCGG